VRPLELALLLVNAPLLAWCLTGRALPPWGRALPVIAFLVMAVHVMFEGARWHMGLAYLVTIYLFFGCAGPRALLPGRCTAVAGGVMLLLTASVATVLPVFDLPKPTGPYPIGTVTLHLIDTGREETQNGCPGQPRELMVQIWYPAEQVGPGQIYRPRAETDLKKSHLALVRTHAAKGVPVAQAQARYPVVLFSPAWTGRRNQNTVQIEELASHGFVVVGIDHPYGTDLTVFPDGRIAHSVLGAWMDYSSEESFQACVGAAEAQVLVRAADVRFVLDELERLDRSDPDELFTGRMDHSRVGIFGHSLGGSVAAEVCTTDPRFKAGINLDGVIFGHPTKKSIGKPFMVFSDDGHVATPAELAATTGPVHRELALAAEDDRCIRQRLSESGGYFLTIRGSKHMDFCDSPLYSPVKRLTHAGPIATGRAMEIINAYVLAFFEANLNRTDEPLLNAAPSPYPEVEFERFSNARL
jgi:predicted dienelactone hydrolase